jgi:hypothetical protein
MHNEKTNTLRKMSHQSFLSEKSRNKTGFLQAALRAELIRTDPNSKKRIFFLSHR